MSVDHYQIIANRPCQHYIGLETARYTHPNPTLRAIELLPK